MKNLLIGEVEFCINTINRTTGETPAKLLFGTNQTGHIQDNLRLIFESMDAEERLDLGELRQKAIEKIKKNQSINKLYYDKRHIVIK